MQRGPVLAAEAGRFPIAAGLGYFIDLSKSTVKVINEVLNIFNHFHPRQYALRCLHQTTDRLEPQIQSTQPKCLKYTQPQDVTVN